MTAYPFLTDRKGKCLLAAFLLAMLYLARDSLFTAAIIGFTRGQLLMGALVGLLGLTFLVKNRRALTSVLKDRRVLAMAAAGVIFLLPMVIKRDWQLMYFSMLFCVLTALFLSLFTDSRELGRYYVLLMTGIGLYSVLATYILRIPADRGMISVPMFSNAFGARFYHFGLTFVSESFVKNRNFGIFREPGVYQFFLLLALYLNYDRVDWQQERTRWILHLALSVAMLSTLATGGYAELAILWFVLFLEKKLYRSLWCWLLIFGTLLAGVVIVLKLRESGSMLYWELYGMTVAKFQPGQESAVDRLTAVFSDLDSFLHHPLLGDRLATVLHAVDNNTSSTLILFAVLGLGGGALHLAAWTALVWKRERSFLINGLLLLMLLMSFNTQNLTADLHLWLIPVMALAERCLYRKEETDGTGPVTKGPTDPTGDRS